MANPGGEVGPNVLQQARELVHLSAEEAATRANQVYSGEPTDITAEEVLRLERGFTEPTIPMLDALAATYLVPFTAFFHG